MAYSGTTTDRSGRVVSINFYRADRLPAPLAKIAKDHGQTFTANDGVVAVKTMIGSPPTYEFERVGSSPKEVKTFVSKLAKEDGTNINDALKRAFADEG